MMTLLSRYRGPRLVAAAVVIAVAGATAGAAMGLLMGDDGAPPLVSDEASAAVGPNGEPQIVAADPAVEFPKALASLPGPPSHLAVDPSSGDLWFVMFTCDGVSNTLYHYSASDGSLETFAIPSNSGSELYSAIGVDSRGHVISAEGTVMTDFDPASRTFTQTDIGEPDVATVAYSPPDGTQILDMVIGKAGTVYLSRINVPAITELDLATGKSREFPYPSSFGPAYDIELAGGVLWLTSRWSVEGMSEAQTGRIDLAAGAFASTGPAMTALAATADGRVFGVQATTANSAADLGWATERGLAPLSFASEAGKALPTGGLGMLDYVGVAEGEVAWVGSLGSESIFRIDTRTGAAREYKLPVYDAEIIPVCGPPDPHRPEYDPCAVASRLKTQVGGLAAAPSGDLYFSDATLNRIGVIHAGK